MVDPGRALAGELLDHDRAALLRRPSVITGFAGGDRGTRGRVKAFDAKDGRLIWTFYTIPGPGELGHDTWPQDNDAWKYGGASVWQTPAVDPELGLIYFSTGNPGPDYNGAVPRRRQPVRGVDRRDRAATGKYRWHFQQVHHDIWDYDSANPVVLFDVNIDGRMRKAIAEVGKTGWAYILDRETGKPLVGIDERPVPQEPRQATAATQPFPRGDAIVPQSIEIAPEGHALVNDGRIFTPFSARTRRSSRPASGAARTGRRARTIPCSSGCSSARRRSISGFTGGGDREVRGADERRRATSAARRRSRACRAPASSRRST